MLTRVYVCLCACPLRLDLVPINRSVGLKAKPTKPVTEVLRPVVAKYGLNLPDLVAKIVSGGSIHQRVALLQQGGALWFEGREGGKPPHPFPSVGGGCGCDSAGPLDGAFRAVIKDDDTPPEGPTLFSSSPPNSCQMTYLQLCGCCIHGCTDVLQAQAYKHRPYVRGAEAHLRKCETLTNVLFVCLFPEWRN